MAELQARERSGSTVTSTLVSVTFDTRFGPAYHSKAPEARIEEVNNDVAVLGRELRSCGLASLRLATSAELAAILRGAFTPSLRADLAETLRGDDHSELVWALSGPTTAESLRNWYEHDGNLTLGWVLADAPRSAVTATVLHRFLAPGRFPKRVTLIWTPTKAAKAAEILELERTKNQTRSLVRTRGLGDETARDQADRQAADDAARDEARGAGLGDFTFVATQTLEMPLSWNDEQRDRIVRLAHSEITGGAGTARLALRECSLWHDIALMTSVGAGVNPTTAVKARR